MLTDNAIRTLRATETSRKLFDERGLYLLVTPAGARLWRFKYYFPPRTPDNKEKCISLGTWPEVSLEQARERRNVARRDVASGIDPTLRRTCEKSCLGDTFEAVAREFLSVLRAANLPAETPSSAAAHLTRQALTSPRYRRPVRTGALLRAIEVYPGEPLTRLALKLMPYIFPRPIEFRTMEWAHVQLHGAFPEWRVPWRRMKMRAPHIVPLARQAADILREVRLLTGTRRWVFPQLRHPERPMSGCCITAALRALGFGATEMSWHGFRSLASTQLHELGWNDRWIETQLSHADRNKVRGSYNHAKYLPQRRTMMQAWADYVDSLRSRGELGVSHQAGQQSASTAMDAFQSVESERALSFQAQAMEALRAIIALSQRQ